MTFTAIPAARQTAHGARGLSNFVLQSFWATCDIPRIAITSPANGTYMSSNVTVTAETSDMSSINGVQFVIDNQSNNSTPGSLSGKVYSFSFDSRSLTDGPHTITATASNSSGNSASSSVRIMVWNNAQAPLQVLTVTNVSNGATGIVNSTSPLGIASIACFDTAVNSPTRCSSAVPMGTTVVLAANLVTTTGGTVSWINCDSTPSAFQCVVTMNGNKTVGASFAPGVPETLNVLKTPAGQITSDISGINCGANPASGCTGSFTSGSLITLTASGGTVTWKAGAMPQQLLPVL